MGEFLYGFGVLNNDYRGHGSLLILHLQITRQNNRKDISLHPLSYTFYLHKNTCRYRPLFSRIYLGKTYLAAVTDLVGTCLNVGKLKGDKYSTCSEESIVQYNKVLVRYWFSEDQLTQSNPFCTSIISSYQTIRAHSDDIIIKNGHCYRIITSVG